MSQTDVVTVLKIETGESENTIKSIKKEISDLKKVLEGAEIGSEAFEKASRDLAAAQQQLKTVMDSTKKTVQAADGSYDALVATMAQLKKEWRATSDEAKRNEIGKQIEAINTELKELDATLGNHQRNVGNYKGDIIDAYREIQGEVKRTNDVIAGSAASLNGDLTNSSQSVYDYGKAWSEVQKGTEQTRAKFESVQKMASGVASGFAALQGVTALLGSENENLQKVLVKVQAAMAIAQGIGGLKDLIEGFTQAKTAFAGATMGLKAMTTETVATTAAMNGAKTATIGATTAVKGFKSALITTGIGALLVGLGLLIDKLTSVKEEASDVNDELEDFRINIDNIVSGTARWKQQYQTDAINEYLQAVKDANGDIVKLEAAQRKFEEDTAANTEKTYKARLKRFYELRDETIDQFAGKLKTQYTAITTQDIKENPKILGSILNEEYLENLSKYTVEEMNEITALFSNLADWVEAIEDLEFEYNNFKVEQADKDIARQKAANDKMIADAKAANDKKRAEEERAAKIEEERQKVKEAKGNEIVKRASAFVIDTKEEELAELKKIYDEEEALLVELGENTENLTEEYQKKKFEIIKKYLDEELNLISENSSKQTRGVEITYEAKTLALDNPTSSILPSLKGEDNIAPIQLEIDKTLELQAIREQAFNEQMAQIQAILDAELENDMLTAEQEAELQKQYNAIQQQKIESTADANNQISTLNKQLVKQQQADNRQLAQNITTTFTSALNAASNILSAVQEGIDTTNKEGFEKNKKLQIANATIGMLVGITNAIAGLFTTKSGPWDIALAALQAGAIATAGGIQIANIKKQTFDGSGGSSGNLNGGVGVSPNISMADMIPINYTKDVLTDTETAELNKQNKVYVVEESDITETQRNVKVKEDNASF